MTCFTPSVSLRSTAPSERERIYLFSLWLYDNGCLWIEFISYGVGRWLAAAEEINENRTAFGCYRINDYMKIKPSSDEEGGTPQA